MTEMSDDVPRDGHGDPLLIDDGRGGQRQMTWAESERIAEWARDVADPAKRDEPSVPDDPDRLRARIERLRESQGRER